MNSEIKEELKQFAYDHDMDYFGVSSIERLANLPEGHRPDDMLPTAKCVIVLGMKLNKGVLEADHMAFEGNRIPLPVFTQFGVNKPSEMTNVAALKMVRYIERTYKMVTMPIPSGEPHDEYIFMGTMSNRYAALCAGLGEMTWSGFVATPDAGPRVKWVSLITELPLDADPLYSGPKLCDHGKCNICTRVCPAHALSDTESVKIRICDYETEYAIHGIDVTDIRKAVGRLTAEGAEALVLGCTELPVAFDEYGIGADVPLIDPTSEIAKSALRYLGRKIRDE